MPAVFAWAAALAELVGGLLVAFGLLTRWAALFGAATMFVAAFLRHRALSHWLAAAGIGSPSEETLKAWGNPEMATLFLLILLALALLGPGGWSLDAKLRRRRR
jgi:putative oxidoreductase